MDLNEVDKDIEALQDEMMELLTKRNGGELTDKEYEQRSRHVGMQTNCK